MIRLFISIFFTVAVYQHSHAHDFSLINKLSINKPNTISEIEPYLKNLSKDKQRKMHGVLDNLKLWPIGFTLRVCFYEGPEKLKAFFVETSKEWTKIANIKFDFGNSPAYRNCGKFESSHMRVAFDKDQGDWSYVGRDSLKYSAKPSMNIGYASIYGFENTRKEQLRTVILHEVGHSLGLQHEHQSPEAKCEKEFNWKVIYNELSGPPNNWPKNEIDQNLRQLTDKARLRVTAYDPKSIMHYALPESWFINGKKSSCFVSKNLELSSGDKNTIKLAYPETSTQQKKFITNSGKNIEKLIEEAELSHKEAKEIAKIATLLVKELHSDLKFVININTSSQKNNSQGDVSTKVEGNNNTVIQGVQDGSSVTIGK